MKVGDAFGQYRLTRPLGSGAMGVVWAAVNERTEREVALKFLVGAGDEMRQRLRREAVACGRLDHRNVIAIHDVGETPAGEPFLVMQLLSGETLGDKLRREGKLAPAVAARLGAAVAAGLAAAHGVGVIHRDLKPANIFLHRETGSAEEVVKLLDFGVSRLDVTGSTKLTETGEMLGSPAYMSPEQAHGSTSLTPATDLWALGVVLFEMVTGTRPFLGASLADVVVAVVSAPIPSLLEKAPDAPAELGALVKACLTRDPGERPGSAAEVAEKLRALAAAPPVSGRAAPASGAWPMPNVALPSSFGASARPAPRGVGETTPMLTTPMLRAPAPRLPAQTARMGTTPMLRAGKAPPAPPPADRTALWIALGVAALAVAVTGFVLVWARDTRPAPAGPDTSRARPREAAPAQDEPPSESPRAPSRPARAPEAPARPRPGVATVTVAIESDTPAQVFVDERAAGSTPLALELPPGSHELRFTSAAHGEKRATVEVKPGVPMALNVQFEKPADEPAP